MRLHGSVSLALFALSHPLLAQEPVVPRPLDAIDAQLAPELNSVTEPTVPKALSKTAPDRNAGGAAELEAEIEALRADLRTFHVLGDEVARGLRAAESEADRTLVRQRQEMLDILTRIATQGITKKAEPKHEEQKPVPPAPPAPDSTSAPVVTDRAVDNFALGKVLFRAGEYGKAEQAFRKVQSNSDNALMLKYLIATCLRKQFQWTAATELYREVADSDKDPVLRDLAKFQLDGIRWNHETEQQINQLRKQREQQAAPAKK